MSFKIAQRPVVGYPVSISVYDEKGKTQKLEFIAQYKRSKRPELQDLIAAARNLARKNAGLEPIAEVGVVGCRRIDAGRGSGGRGRGWTRRPRGRPRRRS